MCIGEINLRPVSNFKLPGQSKYITSETKCFRFIFFYSNSNNNSNSSNYSNSNYSNSGALTML